jgi:hypothetical protein
LPVKDVQQAALGEQTEVAIGNALGEFAKRGIAVFFEARVAEENEIRFKVLR